jgi:Leucine-rich repeat (LRR) protein
LPNDIGKLSGLTELSLSDNDSLNTLPSGLMNCTELTQLEIDGTDISPGALPSDLLDFLKERVSQHTACVPTATPEHCL